MIEPALRLRRAIHAQDTTLASRILKSHPWLIQNPDTTPLTTRTPSGLSNTSLHLAASLGYLPICELLLNLGHEGSLHAPQISLNENYETPLHLAAHKGHTEVIHLLCVRCPTSIRRRDVRGMNALMAAAMGGHDTAVQLLLTFALSALEEEEDPKSILDAVDHDGNTALHYATMYGHLLVLRTLIAAGADWEKRNGWSWQPVSYSATVQVEVYFKGLVGDLERKKNGKRDTQKKDTRDIKGASSSIRLLPTGYGDDV